MVEEHDIKDLYVLKLHAEQSGSSVREYMRQGRRFGLTDRQIIQTALKSQTLEDAVTQMIRRRTLGKVATGAMVLALGYAVNFGINTALAGQMSNDLKFWQRTITEDKEEFQIYLNDIQNLPQTEWRKHQLAGYESAIKWATIRQDSLIQEHSDKIRKAYNPLSYFF